MPDLTNQIRIYYEATTEPVDIDTIIIDPGIVLVGPFPDAAQKRSAAHTVTPEKPPTSPLWKGLATAAAVVLILVVAGVVLSFAAGRDEVEPAVLGPDDEAVPAQETTVQEALEVVDRYWAAYDAGDFAAVAALFAADATTERFSRSEFFAWIEQYRAWNIAQGTTQTPRDCNGTERADGGVQVTCTFEDLPVLHEAVGAPPVRITIDMEVNANGIQAFWFTPESRTYDAVSRSFQQWLEEHHPNAALPVDWTIPITLSNSVEEAERIGKLRAEYAEEWSAYLEANGCTYQSPAIVGCS